MSSIIELTGGAARAFQTVDAQLGENFVTLHLSYMTSIDSWAMDIEQDGVKVYAGIMLRSNADMLESWQVADTFGGLTLIGDEPTIDNLGAANVLVWAPPDDI